MLYEKNGGLACPLAFSVSTFSGKWKPYIIWHLSDQGHPVRYSELKRMLPFNVSHKVLAQQLKELASDGIIARHAKTADYNDNVLQVEYSLTPAGKSLCNILYLLRDWGSLYGNFDCTRDVLANSKCHTLGNKRLYSVDDAANIGDGSELIVWMRAQNKPMANRKGA